MNQVNQVNQHSNPDPYDSFQRYLAAKVTVDDRALNRHVWERLAAALPAPETLGRPLRVLEVGAGIGTMVERFLAWLPPRAMAYTALDALPENIAEAQRRERDRNQVDQANLRPPLATRQIEITWLAADLFNFVAEPHAPCDLLIAHAFLDLMGVPATLPRLFAQLAPGGLFYFTIVFDGVTAFEPAIDPPFDALVEALYHRTMDDRITAGRPSGDSQCGRHLFSHLAAAGATLLAAGASDWVVHPDAGCYPADEAYFLHFIIHTVATALAGQPELDPDRFARWIRARHAQIEAGALVYIAHQMDFLGRSPVSQTKKPGF